MVMTLPAIAVTATMQYFRAVDGEGARPAGVPTERADAARRSG
jgi:hypothetical protein